MAGAVVLQLSKRQRAKLNQAAALDDADLFDVIDSAVLGGLLGAASASYLTAALHACAEPVQTQFTRACRAHALTILAERRHDWAPDLLTGPTLQGGFGRLITTLATTRTPKVLLAGWRLLCSATDTLAQLEVADPAVYRDADEACFDTLFNDAEGDVDRAIGMLLISRPRPAAAVAGGA